MTDTTYLVTGMTCGHCVNAVTSELIALEEVTAVTVDLDAEGASSVHVTSSQPLSEEVLLAALDEAGDYHLVTD
jgi:copper chaperone